MVKKKSSSKKKNSILWKQPKFYVPIVLIVIAFILLLLFVPFSGGADVGDTVSVSYSGTLSDGTVFDTNVEEVAIEAGLEKEAYPPLTFVLGDGSMIPGFDMNVMGMKVDETKTFTLSPEEGYGAAQEDLIFELPLVQELNQVDIIPLDQYVQIVGEDPVINEVISTEIWPWDFKVLKVEDDSVEIENLLNIGDKIELATVTWISEVTELNEGIFYVMQNPTMGDIFYLPNGGNVMQGEVVETTEENFKVDFNNPLVGEELTFEVTLLEIA